MDWLSDDSEDEDQEILPLSQAQFTRTVPHTPGTWACHVFVEIPPLEEDIPIQQLCRASHTLYRHESLHLSLSRPLYVPQASVESLEAALRSAVAQVPPFRVTFQSRLQVLSNDDTTRTFLVRPATLSDHSIVTVLDRVLSTFQLPIYYDPALFHVSLVSTQGTLKLVAGSSSSRTLSLRVTALQLSLGTVRHVTLPLQTD